uniref:Uncharacterized protein n=1 Tax=Hyaloperonospora arabidopsidis (strain Emoy2) TaxID=559515 RepID=M4B7Y7_HYAAE
MALFHATEICTIDICLSKSLESSLAEGGTTTGHLETPAGPPDDDGNDLEKARSRWSSSMDT